MSPEKSYLVPNLVIVVRVILAFTAVGLFGIPSPLAAGAAVVAGWTRTRAPHGPTGSLRHVPPGPRRHPRPIAGRAGPRSRTLTRHATRGIGNVDHIAHGTRDSSFIN